jgi:hypothetical protein
MFKASFLAFAVIFASLDLFAQIGDFKDADFRKADSIAALYSHHSLVDLRILSQKLAGSLSREEEKFRSIYKWVCDNIDNDYSLFSEHKKQRERLDAKTFEIWNRKFSTNIFRILVSEHKTVCTGYARLVSELATYAGLECRVVDGYGRSVQSNIGGDGVANHSWNAVRLNSKWYLCDPTWSSGVVDGPTGKFVRRFNEVYFLLSPEHFSGNHYPLDTACLLTKKFLSLNEFLNGPLIYVDAFRYGVKPIHPDMFRITVDRWKTVFFKFEKNTHVDSGGIQLRVDSNSTNDQLRLEQCDDETLYSFNHVFKSRGKFAVHIMIDDRPVVSYEVTVK